MNEGARLLLYWAPRLLALLFAAFLSIFALDVFSGEHGFWETMVALLMHLVPTAVILVVTAIAWRWEWAGAIVFALLGVAYIVRFWGRFPASVYLFIAGPLFLIALLFLVGWIMRAKLRPAATPSRAAESS
jgi:hypothetical protein